MLIGCSNSVTFHEETLRRKSYTIQRGDLGRALTSPIANIVEFKYSLKDGSIEIINIYPQKTGYVFDDEINEPARNIVDRARENNVNVNPKTGHMVDYVIIYANGTYQCPYPILGTDGKTYEPISSISVFYGHDGEVTGIGDALIQTAVSPLTLAMMLMGDKPQHYTLKISMKRMRILGRAVEAETLAYIKNRINSSTSAKELLNYYRDYNNLPDIETALSRARQLDPSYVDYALPSINAEIAAAR
jgi:hypothetical protein